MLNQGNTHQGDDPEKGEALTYPLVPSFSIIAASREWIKNGSTLPALIIKYSVGINTVMSIYPK